MATSIVSQYTDKYLDKKSAGNVSLWVHCGYGSTIVTKGDSKSIRYMHDINEDIDFKDRGDLFNHVLKGYDEDKHFVHFDIPKTTFARDELTPVNMNESRNERNKFVLCRRCVI